VRGGLVEGLPLLNCLRDAHRMQFTLRMTTMHLMQNTETIDRLVAQGEFLLKTFHAGYEKDPAGYKTEFLCGKLAGWRDTLHTLYHDCAEEIVDRVVAKTCLAIPDSSRSIGFTRLRHEECEQYEELTVA
jgi:hypothetical protein